MFARLLNRNKMEYRVLGKTGFRISTVSLGTWQVGGKWGSGFNDALAQRILAEAVDNGVNFIDTADVYEDGQSETAIGKFLKTRGRQGIYVATKCGRQIRPHENKGYTPEVLRGFVEASLKRLGTETIDLVQLHCPPTQVYYWPEIFGLFERLREEGKILHLGVSVEKTEEALKAIEFENVATVQIIYNILRQRPEELFFPRAEEKNVGIIARVPLASGLLTGKVNAASQFLPTDHRHGNRNGEWFDKGETFSGVPFYTGLAAAEALNALLPKGMTPPGLALKWILRKRAVTCAIPGASNPAQTLANIRAAAEPDLTPETEAAIKSMYDRHVRAHVHQSW